MKKLLSAFVAIAFVSGVAVAQDVKKEKQQGRHGKEMALQQLNLTENQKQSLKTIREKQREELADLKKNDQMTVADRKAKRKELHEKYKQQYQGILTEAQKAELKNKKAQRGEKGRAGKGKAMQRGKSVAQQGAFLKKELNLSADQEIKIKSIHQDFRKQSSSVRSDNTLSQDDKKAKMKLLATDYMSKAKAVLDAEQLKKFEAMQDQRKNKRNAVL